MQHLRHMCHLNIQQSRTVIKKVRGVQLMVSQNVHTHRHFRENGF